MQQPNLIISSLDLDRLERLLETLPAQQAMNHPLQGELDRAEVIEPGDMPADVVTMNSTVRFRLAASGEEHSLTLVYPKDVQGDPDRISVLAPVGSALLGLKVGDQIDWPGPAGQPLRVTILEVLYQPERAGELHR
ncbi:transcription elongation factor GreA/GreB [Aeromonas diversa CDC 2478-85]|uniref:Transcription elongation factor GreA/GreB n=1 Tax=Aeromonas diversa CDC 2478-85 TaxID=1268237 RepID=N9TWB7_9GAMM|nr:nucleoside diphosphate kinase regulator [Aeromonas diversa]ENY70345.1 transcription elongation factor GreA/GreB [Aeromonas diversa CDC 2478-85]